jgi:hypothetical protein
MGRVRSLEVEVTPASLNVGHWNLVLWRIYELNCNFVKAKIDN